ncbi:tRNA1(Val) (adenine(37)-N6)-methyltransferase [Zhouia sp. PK063]|uniref:tRNA1(Val) (adenine(37)-N6)-methyltransferase n=1 Tax=Zhouia sp. PK063 TaxID=3373602 RepID=UPI0037B16BA1
MSQKPFKFKQFTVAQDKCAMKVGTDGVLLGAIAPVHQHPFAILDIGAGTGLIALMLAQRSHAEIIDALELDADAYEQCVENFENSDWGDRLFCYHASFQEFVAEMDEPYDLIVSNPPFYAEDVPSKSEQRDKARQTSSLPFEELLAGTAKLLAADGIASFIIPYKEHEDFITLAEHFQLFPQKLLHIKGNESAPFKRTIVNFSFRTQEHVEMSELIIEEERHQYTAAYKALCNAFYLNF